MRVYRFTASDDDSEEDIYVRKPKVKKIRKTAKSKKHYSRVRLLLLQCFQNLSLLSVARKV